MLLKFDITAWKTRNTFYSDKILIKLNNCNSLVGIIFWKVDQNTPWDHIANNVNCNKASNWGPETLARKLGKGITWVWLIKHALITRNYTRVGSCSLTIYVCCIFIVIVIELIRHQSLVTVLDDGKIFKFLQPVRNVSGSNKETSEKHERNNKNGGKCHSKLLVGERSWDNQGVTRERVVNKDKNEQVDEEGLSGGAETDGKVANKTEQSRDRNREGELRHNLGPEVRWNLVHIVVDLTEEDGTLLGENENNVLNSIEGTVHSHEEESALHVLNALASFGAVPKQERGENSSHGRGGKLHIWGLRKTHNVAEVTGRKQLPLIAEAQVDCGNIGSWFIDFQASGVLCRCVTAKLALNVISVEELNKFLVLFLDTHIVVVKHGAARIFFCLKLNTFNWHHAHKVISGVAHFGASETDAVKIFDRLAGLAKVDNLATSE